MTMRRIVTIVTAVVATATVPAAARSMLHTGTSSYDRPASPARQVVVAELFTSEGCSSCPPADDLLRQLLATQPVEGVELVGLGEHVDYWDDLGWHDRFSSPAFSARQSAYDDAVFRANSIYTPQLVVDGVLQGVGNDASLARRLLQRAAHNPHGRVALTRAATASSSIPVDLEVHIPATVSRKGVADVVIAVTEDGLVTQVPKGENRGRSLSHSAVVRSMTTVAHLNDAETTLTLSSAVPVRPDWDARHLRLVAFVQEQGSRRILAAAAMPALP